MQRIAVTLGLDPLDVIRRNLVPSGAFPYRCPAGAILDSGDYPATVDAAVAEGGLAELRAPREEAHAEGRLYGIGYAAIVEPSISNMGYITTALTAEDRARAGPKSGAQTAATVALDPLGGVSAVIDSVPQGQGHRTVVAQVVGEVFGLPAAAIRVNTELDTGKDAWSIAAGNYSSRFAGAVAGAAYLAAVRLRDKLTPIAAPQLNIEPDEVGSPTAKSSRPPTLTMRSASLGSPGRVTGRRDRFPMPMPRHCAKPYSGHRPGSTRRPRPTKSTARPPMASFSISAASRLTATPDRCASINT